MSINWFTFLLVSLAVFRLTRLLVYDQITEFIRRPFMQEYEERDENGKTEIYLIPRENGLRGWIGQLISCYWCTGIWVTLFLLLIRWLYPEVADPLIYILSVAGAASIIETVIQSKIYEE
ncbi:DUF1360 domain-containing protein [Lederbergia sp. NSJ-179]|uniref:DUF1360 domain-containing protein n=1 Tax=Lederbergia sp. NSJ-179 TaxID=2931402 RepID=UPI001FD02732|nr:DUF1360 domain-containing protein [Lederbergia sp. NSJ-179]MCJ7840344.1 DUF1360 domain-containing protein [Lederbergia sp. NSJ-179]